MGGYLVIDVRGTYFISSHRLIVKLLEPFS
jgi:hypothetical protein